MELLTLSNAQVVISPYALTVTEFKAIWDKYPANSKDDATQELSFVYFMTDYRSPYTQYAEAIRPQKIIQDVMVNKAWTPDNLVVGAILKYNELQQTPSMGLLQDAQKGVDQIRLFLRSANLLDDPKGTKVTQLMNVISKVGDIIKGFSQLMLQVQNEQTSAANIRGGGRVGSREVPKEKREKAA